MCFCYTLTTGKNFINFDLEIENKKRCSYIVKMHSFFSRPLDDGEG